MIKFSTLADLLLTVVGAAAVVAGAWAFDPRAAIVAGGTLAFYLGTR